VLIAGVALGLIAGLLAGGSFSNLAENTRRLRWLALLFIGTIVRFGEEAALEAHLPLAEALRLPLFVLGFVLLLAGLWANRREPGLVVAFVGIFSNLIPIIVNGGYMPIWGPSLAAAGFTPADVQSPFHTILAAALDNTFLAHAGPLGDVVPIPFPLFQNVASIGDVFLAGGLGFFLFASLVRGQADREEAELEYGSQGRLTGLAGTMRLPRTVESAVGGQTIRAETGLAAGLAEASALQRPLVLGSAGSGLAAPALAPLPREYEGRDARRADPFALRSGMQAAARTAAGAPGRTAAPAIVERARHNPYVRLALNGSFSAMWLGQLISLFGDRVNQIAIAFFVLGATNSPLAVALVFFSATLPNLILGPVAGTLVDRWDHKEVLVVSDLLRATIVLLVPVAAVTNVVLVYPLVFLVTTVSIFFRPARTAVVPRIVPQRDLLTANSATWIGETLADIAGYPLAGLFVAFLGSALPLAFWFDAATYIASAALLATMAIPPVRRAAGSAATRAGDFRAEILEGWQFLRRDSVLLANTIQGAIGQFTGGVLLALTALYAHDVIVRGTLDATAAYAFLETGIGVGNLIGGFVIGLVGARLAKGRLVIAGYAVWGACVALLAVTGSLPIAVGLMLGSGIANMVYVIPSQTLFQERVPAELIGRVVGFRFSLVFGSMTIAMALSGVLATVFGVAPVIGLFGLTTMVAGLAGIFVPAVRDA
jgi:MFS family permease